MSRIALILSSPFSMSASTRFLKLARASATAVLSTIIALAQLASEPTARNSKRLPVNANGDVRLRSVLSMSSSGISGMSSFRPCLPATLKSSSLFDDSMCPRISVSWCPRNDEMMAGGASLAPRRCAFVALMMLALSSPLCLYTAMRVSTMKTMKRRLSSGVLPGPCRSMPLSVARLQLLCLPEPLTPAKGFSCRSTRKPCRRATFFISDMRSMLWSMAMLVSS